MEFIHTYHLNNTIENPVTSVIKTPPLASGNRKMAGYIYKFQGTEL